MKNKSKKNFTITGVLFLLFIVFTIIVKTVDVKDIGPEKSSVGLATINQFFFQLFGENLLWYNITSVLGVVAILFALGFGILGLYQLIKGKSFWEIDGYIILLGIFYVIVIIFYVFFEVVIINYRPVILETSIEASYPSSHTMLIICIMSTAMMQFHHLFGNKKTLLMVLDGISVLMMLITIIGRFLSGVHWFTDIIAGILLSSALVMLYYSMIMYIKEQKRIRSRKK